MTKHGIAPDELATLKTTKEVAKMCHVTERTVVNWRNNGMIGFYKIGGRILFSEQQICTFLNSQIQEPFAENYYSPIKKAA